MNRLRLLLIWLLCLLASGYAALRMLYAVAANSQRAWTLYQAHDQLANAARGGDPDKTLLGSDRVQPVLGRWTLFALWLLCLWIGIDAALRMLVATVRHPEAAWVMAVAPDQLANAAANGSRTETISSRAHRARAEMRRWGCRLCLVLDWIDAHHCRDSAGI